jgi:hypothetical protein
LKRLVIAKTAKPRLDRGFALSILARCHLGNSRLIRFARHKDSLQHVSFDRFLQNRNLAETRIYAVGVIASDEDERHAAHTQDFRHRINKTIAKIDIEHCGVEMSFSGRRQSLRRCVQRADHLIAEFVQCLLDHHGDERFVLNQQHTRFAVTLDTDDRASAAVCNE